MDKLPLRSVAEIAFLAADFKECVDFYRKLGLEVRGDPGLVNFSNLGGTLFGIADEKRGWFDGRSSVQNPQFVKPPLCSRLHIAFEVPDDKLDECMAFLESKGIRVSQKIEFGRHTSAYFADPEKNRIELTTPGK